MRIGKEGYFHLGYCSNIHPGETWAEVYSNLKKFIPQIKTHLAPEKSFGIGLRLSNIAACELMQNAHLSEFHQWLLENQLYVYTINGFPYGGFHNQRVKEQVYAPDWLTFERRDYSLKLLRILAALTPVEGESGFSTTPISYKPWLSEQQIKKVCHQACLSYAEIVSEMVALYDVTGKVIHIDIEAEPDCLIETTEEAVQFFKHWLIPVGAPYLAKLLNVSTGQAEQYLRKHVRVCYDICHSSVEFEQPAYVFKKIKEAGILIGKIQVSAALKCKVSMDENKKAKLVKRLSTFADETYLHQVVEHCQDGSLCHFNDLNHALSQLDERRVDELRTHFHVPLFIKHYKMLESTQDDVVKALKLVQKNKATQYLEIETYTWEVLPAELKLDVVSSIEREYEWVMSNFA